MTTMNIRRRASLSLKATLTLVSALAVSGALTDAHAHNKKAAKAPQGAFTSYAVPPPDCDSPVGICTMGALTGDLPSSYWFVMDTLSWGGDPTNPAKFVYTGHSVITTGNGAQMFGSDTGEMIMSPDPMSPTAFVTTVHVVGGTKQFHHTSGTIVATGGLVFATGLAEGTYTSSLTKDNGDDDGCDD